MATIGLNQAYDLPQELRIFNSDQSQSQYPDDQYKAADRRLRFKKIVCKVQSMNAWSECLESIATLAQSGVGDTESVAMEAHVSWTVSDKTAFS